MYRFILKQWHRCGQIQRKNTGRFSHNGHTKILSKFGGHTTHFKRHTWKEHCYATCSTRSDPLLYFRIVYVHIETIRINRAYTFAACVLHCTGTAPQYTFTGFLLQTLVMLRSNNLLFETTAITMVIQAVRIFICFIY